MGLTLVVSTFLLGILFLLALTVGQTIVTLVAAVAAGFAALGIARIADVPPRRTPAWAPVAIAGIATAFGASLRYGLGVTGTGSLEAIAVLIAIAIASGGWILRLAGRRKPCFICHAPVKQEEGTVCPRCSQVVCSRPNCWEAAFARCSACHARQVVLFPNQPSWWRGQFGEQVTAGQCDVCYAEAPEAQLYECGQCHWPMCKRCWDYYNGRCPRCGWTIPSPPPSLLPYIPRRGAARPRSVHR